MSIDRCRPRHHQAVKEEEKSKGGIIIPDSAKEADRGQSRGVATQVSRTAVRKLDVKAGDIVSSASNPAPK